MVFLVCKRKQTVILNFTAFTPIDLRLIVHPQKLFVLSCMAWIGTPIYWHILLNIFHSKESKSVLMTSKGLVKAKGFKDIFHHLNLISMMLSSLLTILGQFMDSKFHSSYVDFL